MNILVINTGSSSVKYNLYDYELTVQKELVSGTISRIGNNAEHKYKVENGRGEGKTIARNHEEAIERIVDLLKEPGTFGKDYNSYINGIGHRVVHGGELFKNPCIIDQSVIEAINKNTVLAPIHNPVNLKGIYATMKLYSNVPQVAVFDTAFHQTMPPQAYIYAIPYDYYLKKGIRRYGFHGISHQYVSRRAAHLAGKPIEELKIITCHLGNGASVTAIDKGKVIDTSMGLTPLEGLVMGTRSGSIDPAIPLYLQKVENLTVDQVDELLNFHSGLIGISGYSNDVRDLTAQAEKGDERSKLALKIFSYNLKKIIGQYVAILGGLDIIVMTGGIGEGSVYLREKTLTDLEYLGIKLDQLSNESSSGETKISTNDSKVLVYIIPTDEQKEIARQTFELIAKKN